MLFRSATQIILKLYDHPNADPGLAMASVIFVQVWKLYPVMFIVLLAALQNVPRELHEAADIDGAGPWQRFRYVTFPIVLPGILGAALLGFSLSFDDFIISYFNAGTLVTFPIYIWGAAQRGIPVQVNALATLVFAISLLIVLGVQFVNYRRRRKLELAVTE